jgi:hypothetical protein
MNTENLVSIHLPVQYWIELDGKNNNISYIKIMNTEYLVSIHLPVMYWTGLDGKNNISYSGEQHSSMSLIPESYLKYSHLSAEGIGRQCHHTLVGCRYS